MGLQVWLPLNVNLDNQGLSDQTSNITTTPIWSSIGKIGGKSLYTKTQMTTMYFPGLVGVSTYSVAYWVYIPTAIAPTAWADIFGIQFNCGGTTIWERDERRNSDTNGEHQYCLAKSASEGSTTNPWYVPMVDSRAKDNWVHTVLVKDDANAKIYINGILHGTWPSIDFENSPRTMTGNVCLGTSGCEAYLQDFRIYDHVLSPREIKEISKGLVLHYPLAMPGQGNLLLNTATPVSWITTHTNADEWSIKDIYNMESPVNQLFEANDTATFSFDWEFTSGSSGSIAGNFHLETGNVAPWILGSVSKSTGTRNNASNYIDLSATNTSGHVTCTFIVSSSAASAADTFRYFRIRWDKTPKDGTLKLSNCKLERGEIATPWIPNPADTAYSTLGFNDGVEYDVSGYQHNGTKVGNITYDADAPRYETSAVFDGETHVINNTSTVHLSNEFTISWWGKINTWKKAWEGMFLLQNTTALNSASGTYSVASVTHASTANIMTLTFRQGGTSYPFDHYAWTYNIGTWAHYACTYKNGVIIMYQNGEQVYTATIDNSSSGDYYYTIGKRVNNCICQLSDFRIYNTALSASDILELYHTPETLSYNGTLLTQGEFVES